MMARIIPFRGDRHRDVQLLLPWYASGRLEAHDLARVEAHLSNCPQCQAELRSERRLRDEVAALPFEAEAGWSQLRARIDAEGTRRNPAAALRRWIARARRTPPWVGWALAAQAVVVIAAGALVPTFLPAERYYALGAAEAAPSANIIVVFQPETPERELRAALNAAGVRLVDGPTAADAYLLHAPPAARDAALATLRKRSVVAMAEPVDPDLGR
jgi:anti-sigma factor RsiW